MPTDLPRPSISAVETKPWQHGEFRCYWEKLNELGDALRELRERVGVEMGDGGTARVRNIQASAVGTSRGDGIVTGFAPQVLISRQPAEK